MNAILDAWVQHSSQIKTLSAKFSRKDKGSAFGAVEFLYEIHWKDSGQAVLDIKGVAGKDMTEYRACGNLDGAGASPGNTSLG